MILQLTKNSSIWLRLDQNEDSFRTMKEVKNHKKNKTWVFLRALYKVDTKTKFMRESFGDTLSA